MFLRLLTWILPLLTLGILLLRQLLNRLTKRIGHLDVPAFVPRDLAALTAVEVVLAGFSLQDLPGLGDLEPLGQCFVRLHIL